MSDNGDKPQVPGDGQLELFAKAEEETEVEADADTDVESDSRPRSQNSNRSVDDSQVGDPATAQQKQQQFLSLLTPPGVTQLGPKLVPRHSGRPPGAYAGRPPGSAARSSSTPPSADAVAARLTDDQSRRDQFLLNTGQLPAERDIKWVAQQITGLNMGRLQVPKGAPAGALAWQAGISYDIRSPEYLDAMAKANQHRWTNKDMERWIIKEDPLIPASHPNLGTKPKVADSPSAFSQQVANKEFAASLWATPPKFPTGLTDPTSWKTPKGTHLYPETAKLPPPFPKMETAPEHLNLEEAKKYLSQWETIAPEYEEEIRRNVAREARAFEQSEQLKWERVKRNAEIEHNSHSWQDVHIQYIGKCPKPRCTFMAPSATSERRDPKFNYKRSQTVKEEMDHHKASHSSTSNIPKPARVHLPSSMEEHVWMSKMRDWEDYKVQCDLKDAAEEQVTQECKRMACEELRNKAEQLVDENATETELLEIFKRLAVKPRSQETIRHAFMKIEQGDRQNPDHYYAQMKEAALRCNFKLCVTWTQLRKLNPGNAALKTMAARNPEEKLIVDFTDEMIRSRLLTGLKSTKIREDVYKEVEKENRDKTVPQQMDLKAIMDLVRNTTLLEEACKGTGLTAATAGLGDKCKHCNSTKHSQQGNTQEARKAHCKAYEHACKICKEAGKNITGHFESACQRANKNTPPTRGRGRGGSRGNRGGRGGRGGAAATLPNQGQQQQPPPDTQAGAAQGSTLPAIEYKGGGKAASARLTPPSYFPTGVRWAAMKAPQMAGQRMGQAAATALVQTNQGIPHQRWDKNTKTWIVGASEPDSIQIEITLDLESYQASNLPVPLNNEDDVTHAHYATAVKDTGSQICSIPENQAREMGLNPDLMIKTADPAWSMEGTPMYSQGLFLADIVCTGINGKTSTKAMIYILGKSDTTYLSRDVMMELGMTPRDMEPGTFQTENLEGAAVSTGQEFKCSEVLNADGSRACGCPNYAPPPKTLPIFDIRWTERDIPEMKQTLLNHFRASAFNACNLQIHPVMDTEPLKINVNEKTYVPLIIQKPAQVPLHLMELAAALNDRDLRVGAVERLGKNETPSKGCTRVVYVAKPGPILGVRRTCDYKWLNSQIMRQAQGIEPPMIHAQKIDPDAWKSSLDFADGYHKIPLAEESRPYTTFITQSHGMLRAKTVPQGLNIAGDAFCYSVEKKERHRFKNITRLIDDVAFWHKKLKEHFETVAKYIDTMSKAGIAFSAKKFQFAQKELHYLGLIIGPKGIRVSDAMTDSIRNFPRPKTLTDMRAFFGLVEQAAFSFFKTECMGPFRDLLKGKKGESFEWTEELQMAFEAAKNYICQQIADGVASFTRDRITLVTTDWSNIGVGVTAWQKYCGCTELRLGCCEDGWRICILSSKFCSGPESRYDPIEGEVWGLSWGLSKNSYFFLGHPNLILGVDHKPLLGILNPEKPLADIENNRIRHFAGKVARFAPFQLVHIPGVKNKAADAMSRAPSAPERQEDQLTASAARLATYDPTPTRPQQLTTWEGIITTMRNGTPKNHLPTSSEIKETMDLEIDQARVVQLLTAASGLLRAISREDIKQAQQEDSQLMMLLEILQNDKSWPKELTQLKDYRPHMAHLATRAGNVYYKNRLIIPINLRGRLLTHLHIGHQGATSRIKRAIDLFWWPGVTEEIRALQTTCELCVENKPSQSRETPRMADPPKWPFEHLSADFFQLAGKSWLVIVDHYTGWPRVVDSKNGAQGVKEALLGIFSDRGIPERLTTDGGSEFIATAIKDFLERWGVKHHITAAYDPHANMRAETAVKSMKRILRAHLDSRGSWTEEAAAAMLEYCNTPIHDLEESPAQLLYGRVLRGMTPDDPARYKQHPEWILIQQQREEKLKAKLEKEKERHEQRTKDLNPLNVGDSVSIQCKKTGKEENKWTTSGTIQSRNLETRQYEVVRDGTGRLTRQARKNLTPIHQKETKRELTEYPVKVTEPKDTTQRYDVENHGSFPPITSVKSEPRESTRDPSDLPDPATIKQEKYDRNSPSRNANHVKLEETDKGPGLKQSPTVLRDLNTDPHSATPQLADRPAQDFCEGSSAVEKEQRTQQLVTVDTDPASSQDSQAADVPAPPPPRRSGRIRVPIVRYPNSHS